MSFFTAVSFARDAVAAALAASAVLAAFLSIYGVAGLTSGLAASLATIAASGLATVALYGLAALLGETPAAIAPWVAGAAAVLAIALGGYAFGVRGLWLGGLVALGVGFGAAAAWSFGGRAEGWFGAAAPAMAVALMGLVTTAALGATLQNAARHPAYGPEAKRAFWRPARHAFATPPDWFDCAFAALGAGAVRPGLCPFNPPEVDSAPVWSVAAPSYRNADRKLARATAPDLPQSSDAADPSPTPAVAFAPAAPSIETPDFDAIIGQEEDVAPATPGALSGALSGGAARMAALGAAAPGAGFDTGSADAPAGAGPQFGPSPAALSGDAARGDAAPPIAGAAPTDGVGPGRIAALTAPTDASFTSAPTAAAAEASRTEYICFPLGGVLAEQLCPDARIGPRDVEVAWRSEGGAAFAAVEGVSCFVDDAKRLEAAFLIDLSAALEEPFDRGSDPAYGKIGKAEAVYTAFTRLIGGRRAAQRGVGLEPGAGLTMSAYMAGGDALRGPWATIDHGVGKADRAFDVGSSGQTLALLRRLRQETQSLSGARDGAAFRDDLAAMLESAPRSAGGARPPIAIAVLDAAVSASLSEADAAALEHDIAAFGAPVFFIELGARGASDRLRRLADPVGGAAFAAPNADRVLDTVERVLQRAQSFCAIGVTAPAALFDERAAEVRLRRRMSDGCQLEQIAVLDCGSLSFDQRILPK